ncbi:putative multidrug resistance protein NorM [Hypericibacter terrae]|uniref:Putative multidrug resistance protein NorM n=1 Tax=Hypericibacter terrae TaxID=2602015 RepID=A0A5J6MNX9_9PROT|nr:putative multidrug resistance protein NorM [Hypericibacter terrae]
MIDSVTNKAPEIPRQGAVSHGIGHHVRRTVALALPVMLARAGLVVMITVDTVMVGQAGGEELAHYAIAFAPQMLLLSVGFGLLIGATVLTAQADGAGRQGLCGRIWRLALMLAAAIGLVDALILAHGEGLLLLLGQEPVLAAAGGKVLLMWAIGMPGIMLYVATAGFLEGVSRPRPGMIVTILANVANAGLNWLMIGGHGGLPAMGAEGAVLATSITRWLMFLALAAYALTMRDHARFGIWAPLKGTFGQIGAMIRLGAPLALSVGFEAAAFMAAATFAGWLGETSLAAYQIALNFNALIYMLALGLATATAVRVANAHGRRDAVGLARAGWVGAGLVFPSMIGATLILTLAPGWVVGFYSDEADVRALALQLMTITAWFILADGAQGVLTGAVRGAADAVMPTLIAGLSFWLVGVPLCYALAFTAGWGTVGLIWGLFVSLIVAMCLLALRFHIVSRRATLAFAA